MLRVATGDRFRLRLEIDFGIDDRSVELGVVQPSANRVDIHSRAQQMSRRRVAQQVRANPLGGQRRSSIGSQLRATADQLANARTGERAPAPVQEDRLPGCPPRDQVPQSTGHVLPQRAPARLAALAPQSDECVPRARRYSLTAYPTLSHLAQVYRVFFEVLYFPVVYA